MSLSAQCRRRICKSLLIAVGCWCTLVTLAAGQSRPARMLARPATAKSAASFNLLNMQQSDAGGDAEQVTPLPSVLDEQNQGGEPYYGEPIYEGDAMHMFGGPGGSGVCEPGMPCGPGMDQFCGLPCPMICLDAVEGFFGVQAFTGPLNRGSSGSFGFHEGVNLGAPLPALFGDAVTGQLGARAVQANFSGAEFTQDDRHQVFVTGGLFRRVDWGFQGGLVVDYFHEGWYLDADFVQLRGELSWVYPSDHELGFWFAANDQQQTDRATVRSGTAVQLLTETYTSTDLYAFFYRRRLDDFGGTTWRAFGGFTGVSDGLVGADLTMPLSACWGLQSAFTYLVPHESSINNGFREESWNVGISLVWRPRAGFQQHSYYRPLLDVAGNGTFMIDRQ